MPVDYSLAEVHAAVLRDDKFIKAMSHINMGAQALIADSMSTKGEAYMSYAKANGLDNKMAAIVDALNSVDGLLDCQGADLLARANCLRLGMKDLSLKIAFDSSALALEDVKGFSTVDKRHICPQYIVALNQLGLPNLAKAAALYLE